jgi:hypothetical protein
VSSPFLSVAFQELDEKGNKKEEEGNEFVDNIPDLKRSGVKKLIVTGLCLKSMRG